MRIVLKSWSGCLLLLFLFAAILTAGLLAMKGGAWLSDQLCPLLINLSIGVFTVSLLLLVPMSFFKRTQSLSGRGLILASYLFGFTLWVLSFSTTYNLWGGFALLIGLILAGVGIVPMAIIATLFSGAWDPFQKLLLLTLITYGTRRLGQWIREKAEGILNC